MPSAKSAVWVIGLCASLVSAAEKDNADKKVLSKGATQAPVSGIDWKDQMVRATGQGAPDLRAANIAQARLGAERAAVLDAMRNLLSQVKGVHVSASQTMGDLMVRDEVRARVEGLLRGYHVVNKRYYDDGGVEVDIEASVTLLTDIFDPNAIAEPVKVAQAKQPAATGLIVDARDLKVAPALAPKITDAAGKVVYSVDSLAPEWRKRSGVAAYVKSMDEAKKLEKIGDQPLVIKAASAKGSDLSLSAEEAQKLLAAQTPFLAQGRVVIVSQVQ